MFMTVRIKDLPALLGREEDLDLAMLGDTVNILTLTQAFVR